MVARQKLKRSDNHHYVAISEHGGKEGPREQELCAELERERAAAPPFWSAFPGHAVKLVRLATPIAATNLCSFALSFISLMFLGRLGGEQLSSAVLATSIFNICGASLIIGFAGGLEIIGGQAYGAENYPMLGVVLQQALFLSTLVCTLVGLLWSQARPILQGIRQDAGVAAEAARFLQILVGALFLTGYFEANNRYLMAQGKTLAVTLCMVAGVALCPLFNYLLVSAGGFAGAAWAVNLTQLCIVGLLAGYTWTLHRRMRRLGDPRRTWFGWSRDAWSLAGWLQYLKFACPAMAMTTLQWWAFEVVVLMSGYLDNAKVAISAVGIVMNISTAFFMIVLGLCTATTICVATSLGAGRPQEARRVMQVSLLLLLLYQLVSIGLLLGLRRHWGRLFTSDPEVVDLVSSVIPTFVLTLPGEALAGAFSGALRGAGASQQAAVAIINATSNWLVGLPLAAVFAFVMGMGLRGLWLGLFIAATLQGLLLLCFVVRIDWQASAVVARKTFHANGRSRERPHHHQNGLAGSQEGGSYGAQEMEMGGSTPRGPRRLSVQRSIVPGRVRSAIVLKSPVRSEGLPRDSSPVNEGKGSGHLLG